jgi:flagellin-like hook-associated protein FlgL
MPSEIVLSRGIRTNLLSIQDHSANLEISQGRLATGKKVNSALDNPQNYFMAGNLRQRGADLSQLLDQTAIAIETMKITVKALESVQKLAESARGIIQAATATTDNVQREQARRSYEEIKIQINQLVQDANFNGKNLLNGGIAGAYNSAFDLRVSFNENYTTQLDAKAINMRATGTGAVGATDAAPVAFVARAANAYDSPAGDPLMQADLTFLTNYISSVRAAASNFGINVTVIQNRQDFMKTSILTLNMGSDALVLADQNEEGAKLLALQTRQQLGVQALSLANQSDQAVLRLFQ